VNSQYYILDTKALTWTHRADPLLLGLGTCVAKDPFQPFIWIFGGQNNPQRIARYDVNQQSLMVRPVTFLNGGFSGCSAVTHESGYIYVVGGSFGGCYGCFVRFNPGQEQLLDLPSLPTARGYAVAGLRRPNRLVVAGGRGGDSIGDRTKITGVTEVFDLELGSWSPQTSLPVPLAESAGAAVGGKVWMFGGLSDSEDARQGVQVLSCADRVFPPGGCYGQWDLLPSGASPFPLRAGTVAVPNANPPVLIVGGEVAGQAVADCFFYSPETGDSTACAALPLPEKDLSCAYLQGTVVCMGGSSGLGYQYTVASNSWTFFSSGMGTGCAVVAHPPSGRVYGFGGVGTQSRVLYFLASDISSQTVRNGILLDGFAGGRALFNPLDEKIYLAGSLDYGDGLTCPDCLSQFDPLSEVSTALSPLPVGRGNGVAWLIEDQMGLAGGSSSPTGVDGISGRVDVYDFRTGEWRFASNIVGSPRTEMGGAVIVGKVYVMGGRDTNNQALSEVQTTYCF
jgi:hypothetical protein